MIMSAIESHLRKAISLQNAQDSNARREVYLIAQKTIDDFPTEQRTQILAKLTAAISKIEAEFYPEIGIEEQAIEALLSTHEKSSFRKTFSVKSMLIFMVLLLVGVFLYQYQTKESTIENAPQEASETKSEPIELISSYVFPGDQSSFLIQRINEEENIPEKSNENLTKISNDTNFLSKNPILIDREKIYLTQLKIKLPKSTNEETMLPVLYAGLYNYNTDDELLDEPHRSHYIIHSKQLKFSDLTIDEDGNISLSGIISGDGEIEGDEFPDVAHSFRLFLGVIMNESPTPLEVISISISSLN